MDVGNWPGRQLDGCRGGARLVPVVVAFLWFCAACPAVAAPPAKAVAAENGLDLKSENVLLIDVESGTTLFEKNADRQFIPGGLVSMMTVAIAFDMVKDGKLTLEQEFPVTEYAWRTGGAPSHTVSMFAPINSNVKVSDLFQGIMVQSANDGALILAEGVAGTVGAFADLMTKKAENLGMTKSVFRNPTGLPDPDQKTTARDMGKLATYLVTTHPDLYKYFAQSDFTYNKIRQANRNPLLNAGIGADGMKTGSVKDGGFNIVASTVQGGQRLILVIGGARSEKERTEEAKRVLDWGYRNFEQTTFFKDGETIAEAGVFGGAKSSVGLKAEKPIRLLLPRNSRAKISARIHYRGPLKAPVEAGHPVGRLVIYRDDQPIQETPVFTAENVDLGSINQRAADAVMEYGMTTVRRWLGWK